MSQHTKKIVNELCNYLGYDLESPMCKELHEHVKNCPECQNYIQSIKTTVRICRDVYKEVPVPDDVKQQLLATIQKSKSRK